MKIRIPIKLFILLGLTLSYASTYSQLAGPSLPSKQQEAALLDSCCNGYREVLEKIDASLEHAALIINNNQVRGIDKKAVIPHIFHVRQFIRPYKENRIAMPTPEYTAHLAKVVESVLFYLDNALKDHFAHLSPFDPQNLITRKPDSAKDLATLKQELDANIKIADSLNGKVQNLGLNIINKAFRRLEKLNNDYNILYYSAWSAGIAATGAFLVWQIDPPLNMWYQSFKTTMQGWSSSFYNTVMGIEQSPTVVKDTIPNLDQNFNITTDNNYAAQVEELEKQLALAQHNGDEEETSRILQAIDIITGIAHKKAITPSLQPINNKSLDHIFKTLDNWGKKSGIYSIGPVGVWYALHAYLKEPFEKGVRSAWNASYNKASECLSYLRGGPIKKTMGHLFERDPKATFDDIIGNDIAKAMLLPIITYLTNPESYNRAGVTPNKKVVLFGPPRTGKSFFAEAVGTEIILRVGRENVVFLSLCAAEIKVKGGIKELFSYLQWLSTKKIVVLLIDEIDTGGFMRQGQNADNEALCELLTALSDLNREKENKLIILACTNKPENLDQALLEPGRFGSHIYFTYPTLDERKEFIMRELRNRTIEIEEAFIEKIASLTENCSFDALNAMLSAALQRAKLRGTSLSKEDILTAYYQEINKIVLNDLSLPREEQHIIAMHQAAQALCRIQLDTKRKVSFATTYAINPDITHDAATSSGNNTYNLKKNKMRYGQVFTITNENTLPGDLNNIDMPKFFTDRDYIQEIKVLLSGQIAEKIINGTTGYMYCKRDQEEALNLAKFVCLQGLAENELPKQYREEKLLEALRLIETCQKEVETLLREHVQELLELANELHSNKIMSIDHMKKVIAAVAIAAQQPALTPRVDQ